MDYKIIIKNVFSLKIYTSYYCKSTSFYTTSAVDLIGFPSCCLIANMSTSGFPVLEEATYNYLWKIIGYLNHTPTS